MASQFRILDAIDSDIRARLLDGHRSMDIPANHQLLFQEDWAEEYFVVVSGLLKVRCLNLEGNEIVLSLMGPGAILGDLALFFPEPRRTADVVALTACSLLKLRRTLLQNVMATSPQFSRAFAVLQCQRLIAVNERLMLLNDDATTRLLATLLNLALLNGPQPNPHQPIPPISQQEIASIAGLSRGTTSTLINKLRTNGTLEQSEAGLRFADLTPLRKRHLLVEPKGPKVQG